MFKFISFEFKSWVRSPMTWIFLGIIALLILLASTVDQITFSGGGNTGVYKNSPSTVQTIYSLISIMGLLMTTAFMNSTANRDFEQGMYQFIFTSPISKTNYFIGKFLGGYVAALIPVLGVSIGLLLSPYMPWSPEDRYGPVVLMSHINGFVFSGMVNTYIISVLLFSLAIIFRSTLISFLGAMALLILYIISGKYTGDIQTEWISAAVDPFGLNALSLSSKYLTVVEKNTQATPISGYFLMNRVVWIGIATVILLVINILFSFTIGNEKKSASKKAEKIENIPQIKDKLDLSEVSYGWNSFFNLVKFEVFSMIKNPTFIILMIISLINMGGALYSFKSMYGLSEYPVTYKVIEAISGSSYAFLLGFIIFYSGVIVWRARDSHFSTILDATPVSTKMIVNAKLLSLILVLGIILAINSSVGVLAQMINGYTRFELSVYFWKILVIDYSTFMFIAIIAVLFHSLINNKNIAYFAIVVYVLGYDQLLKALELNSKMLDLGGSPQLIYSDMNGFQPFVEGIFWYKIYWGIFSILMVYIIQSIYVRGLNTNFAARITEAKEFFKSNKVQPLLVFLAFSLVGGYIYYNTQVLNGTISSKQREKNAAMYEKNYKKYENKLFPRYVSLTYEIDIEPYERGLKVKTSAIVQNKGKDPITEIHFSNTTIFDSLDIKIPNAVLSLQDNPLKYRIYTLSSPLLPGDSLGITFEMERKSVGFEDDVSFLELTPNGTFFNHGSILPQIGYNSGFEIFSPQDRKKYELPEKSRAAKLDAADSVTRRNTYISSDADWVNVKTIISTAEDQIAVAPGSLRKEWKKDGRAYFEYQLDVPSLNFYSFISARYEVARKKWNDIDIEIYYHKEHSYNIENMLKGVEKSLKYYTENFGPYMHKQCRIIEFPRYSSFAQAFPGTMPYSESIGFISDLRNVKEDDIDGVFYVVAHEMGHQYWAHQVIGPPMQGSEMFSEGFAQYSALMVMEKEYGKDKMYKFLKYEMNNYLSGRGVEQYGENPLYKSESQQYIHYNKASVIMYYLKEMIGEKAVNRSLRSLVDSFGYKNPPYPTSIDVVAALRKETPDSLQYLITDLFENITVFMNRTTESSWVKKGNKYEVTINTVSEKYYSDPKGVETSVPINDYIDVGVFAKSSLENQKGKVLALKRVKVTKKENSFTFLVDEEPYEAGIDPYLYLVDRVPSDNMKQCSEN